MIATLQFRVSDCKIAMHAIGCKRYTYSATLVSVRPEVHSPSK